MAKKKILVVDDNPDVIYAIKNGLEALDPEFEVMGARDGKRCLQLLKENKIPDLIILDIMMPELSGWEVFNRLKEKPEWSNIPVVFLTARTDDVAKRAGRFLGEDYIEKPFQPQDLKRRIDRILGKI
jgi:CheY-like chemotaxis protein